MFCLTTKGVNSYQIPVFCLEKADLWRSGGQFQPDFKIFFTKKIIAVSRLAIKSSQEK
jgi:hypothetical protein